MTQPAPTKSPPSMDIAAMDASLWCKGMDAPAGLSWLEDSWRDPVSFWENLLAAHDRRTPGQRKSVAFRHYDFFHDLALRFADLSTPAWVRPAGTAPESSLTYTALARRAAALSETWKQKGIQAGQVVALLLPPGETLAVSLLAAFRLGLVISLLPLEGRGFLQHRLAALKPDAIVMDLFYASLLGPDHPPLLDGEAETPAVPADLSVSAVYPAGSTAALLFDPCAPDLSPRPVTADALYLGAVRDGLLALGLNPSDVYAAPGFDLLEISPCLMLAGWINGATWMDFPVEDLAQHPGCLAERKLKVLGISRNVRDLLLEKSPKNQIDLSGTVRHWFRHPGETMDLSLWNDGVERLGLKKAYAANLAWNSALGGCYLFSPRRLGMVHHQVLPSAGCPWQLGQLPDGAVPAVSDVGLLMLSFPNGEKKGGDEEEAAPGIATPMILSRQGSQWFGIRAPHCGKNGLFYPAEEVQEVASAALPKGLHCGLVTVPAVGAGDDPAQVLLVFTAGTEEKINPAQITGVVRSAVEKEMGAFWVPDQVVMMPLYPRFDDAGKVDGNWCSEQYLTGRLQKKAGSLVFKLLGRVQEMAGKRELIHESDFPGTVTIIKSKFQ